MVTSVVGKGNNNSKFNYSSDGLLNNRDNIDKNTETTVTKVEWNGIPQQETQNNEVQE
jgi:hypothetical protein